MSFEVQRTVLRPIETGSDGYNLAEIGIDSVWFAGGDARLRQLDATTGAELVSFPLIAPPEGLLIAEGSAWVEYYDAGRVERINIGEQSQ